MNFGGGGGGASNPTTANARAGGAGGSSGGFTTLSIPAIFLPDILYVSAGDGGQGGLAGLPADLGGRGVGSYVSVAPFAPFIITTTSATTTATATSSVNHNLATGDSVVITGATPGQYNGIYTVTVTNATTFTYTITSTTPTASSPGTGTIYATKLNQPATVCYANGGTSSAVQANSAANSIAPVAVASATIANMLIAGLGNFSALAGQVGSAGGSFSNGSAVNVTYPTTGVLLSGGSGGGGGSGVFTGGAVSAPTQASYVYFSGLGNAPANSSGGLGYEISQPLLSIGGAGGGNGSVLANNGGNGGRGGIGSGGGGGGGGAVGGIGGDGGPGLVIIHSW